MTDYEVNETLAKFEFNTDFWIENNYLEYYYTHGGYKGRKPLYTESLDAQIPVINKLKSKIEEFNICFDFKEEDIFIESVKRSKFIHIQNFINVKDVARSSAYILYKTIQELWNSYKW